MTPLRQKVGPAAQLSPAAMARIAARLEAEARRPRGQTPMALAGAAVAGALVATMFFMAGRAPQPLQVIAGAQAETAPSLPIRTLVVPEAAAEKPVVHHVRAPEPEPMVAQPEPPAPVAPAPVPESALATESRLLATALAELRNKPAAALAALDDYRARFPHGQLAEEAQVMRVDALLALGRRDAALRALDDMTLGGLPRGRELTLLRAELRSEAGRCRDAMVDFSAALVDAADTLDERALYGRAACRARTGNAEGARSDLQRYLVRFPDGRFAAEARKALEK